MCDRPCGLFVKTLTVPKPCIPSDNNGRTLASPNTHNELTELEAGAWLAMQGARGQGVAIQA